MKRERTTKYSSYVRKDGIKVHVATIELAPDPGTGKRRQKRVTATTVKELEDRIQQVKAADTIEHSSEDEMKTWPMSRYFPWWLDNVKTDLRPSTKHRYLSAIQMHILPQVGSIKLVSLSRLDVLRVQTACTNTGLSNASNNLIRTILSGALKTAAQFELVKDNVVSKVAPKREKKPDENWWTPAQIRRFLEVARTDSAAALWQLAALTGIRRGEILALTWDDIDLENCVLRINKTYSRQGDRFVCGKPKSESGTRPIRLSSSTVRILLEHKERQERSKSELGDAYHDLGLVFSNPIGGYIHPNTLLHWFKRLTKQARLPNIRFHDVRHSNGVMLVSVGTHPKVIQARFGHSSMRSTERYLHSNVSMQDEAALNLDKLAGPE